MDQKQHTFPKFLLEGFSSDRIVHMYDRDRRFQVRITIDRATAIGNFYTLPEGISIEAQALEDELSFLDEVPGIRDSIVQIRGDKAYLKPEALEVFLGYFEGRAGTAIPRLRSEGPPSTQGDRAQERFDIATLMGLQIVRGQSFRDQMDDAMRATIQAQILASPDETTRRWRAQEDPNQPAVVDPIQHLLDSLDGLELAKVNKLGEMLPMAFEHVAPILFAMTWRVLKFDRPDVVSSDEGIGLWVRPHSPHHQSPGIATADAVYFPIDASHILQMTQANVPELLTDGSEAKLHHSNNALASSAHRWILAHPDCKSIDDLEVRPRSRLGHEHFKLAHAPLGQERHLIRFFSRIL